jgi:hypothetical protein
MEPGSVTTADSKDGLGPASWQNAVAQLQLAVMTGRPALIPGALERRPETLDTSIEPPNPHGPVLTPPQPAPRELPEREHETPATPTEPVIRRDPSGSIMLRLIEALITLIKGRPLPAGA